MNESLQQKLAHAIDNPANVGELPGADAVGTVGNSDCGEMLRMWIKYKEEHGRKVIDRATFQSFGCETAIAVASLATELIRGKTPEEALSLQSSDLAADLGPLPPMKIHCAELVQGALRAALAQGQPTPKPVGTASTPASGPSTPMAPTLADQLYQGQKEGKRTIRFLEPGSA